jgi:hypothetical protein
MSARQKGFAHKKAAGVLGTPSTASENHYAPLVASCELSHKTFTTMQARFAMLGHCLELNHRANGRSMYSVSRWGQTRCFTHSHDLMAFLTQVGGAK